MLANAPGTQGGLITCYSFMGGVSFNAYPAPLTSLHTNTTGKLTTAAARKRWDGWHKTWPEPAAAKMF
eukprot:COSAG02_NODE_43226_length_378_cov_0.460432_1_plen_67_part_10